MRLLLDTHIFLWWVSDDPALSPKARRAIGNANNECYVSLASCWEMAIKVSLGKLSLKRRIEQFIPDALAANGFKLLNVDFRHVAKVESLPSHHRDPFDRILVAQAAIEGLTLVTADKTLTQYEVKCLVG